MTLFGHFLNMEGRVLLYQTERYQLSLTYNAGRVAHSLGHLTRHSYWYLILYMNIIYIYHLVPWTGQIVVFA